MDIISPNAADWETFLALAGHEGWRVPEQELELFRGPLAGDAFALRDGGEPLGFVTAVRHERSGWVGNLVVHPDHRGKGYGTLLFDHALEVLGRRGVETIWLTASALGLALYRKKGFRTVDGVVRWALDVIGETVAPYDGTVPVENLFRIDSLVWGESRRLLLENLAEGGEVFGEGETVALLQRRAEIQVLGPWVSPSLCPRENRRVLTAVLAAAGRDVEMVTDVLESSPVSPLLAAAGFSPRGRCELMVKGLAKNIDLGPLVSLASLGSMG